MMINKITAQSVNNNSKINNIYFSNKIDMNNKKVNNQKTNDNNIKTAANNQKFIGRKIDTQA